MVSVFGSGPATAINRWQFLKDDIARQREIAEGLVAQARELQKKIDDPDTGAKDRQEWAALRDSLLKSAKELAENAIRTSTSGASAITTATSANLF
jgi:hypothetical protein